MEKEKSERLFTEEDMKKAFDAGCEWECWSLRGTSDDEEEPYFDEWIEQYKEQNSERTSEAHGEVSPLNTLVSLREYIEQRHWRYNRHAEMSKEKGEKEKADRFEAVADELEGILGWLPEADAT